ncbi:hypothetical protein ACEYYB_03360 [Paracoccus sp. p4-l81]|uniref:hypothetical protein n=1 Tax=unclassified Paracoccus (in: a-proteobacteria) TaxID=2688777 RepID=UPI0035B8C3D2
MRLRFSPMLGAAMVMLGLALCWPLWARAEGGLAALPPGLIDRIEDAAPGVLDDAAELILAYGQDGRIDAAGVDLAIAHARAGRRATALARILAADLDGDGAVQADELAVHLRALSPRLQARAKLAHDRADADGDGHVTADEARISADSQAVRNFSDRSADKLRDLLAMDMNRDGWLGLDEVAASVAAQLQAASAAGPETGPPRERSL